MLEIAVRHILYWNLGLYEVQHNTTLTCFFADCRYFDAIVSQKTLHESTTERGLYKGESWKASTVILIFRWPLWFYCNTLHLRQITVSLQSYPFFRVWITYETFRTFHIASFFHFHKTSFTILQWHLILTLYTKQLLFLKASQLLRLNSYCQHTLRDHDYIRLDFESDPETTCTPAGVFHQMYQWCIRASDRFLVKFPVIILAHGYKTAKLRKRGGGGSWYSKCQNKHWGELAPPNVLSYELHRYSYEKYSFSSIDPWTNSCGRSKDPEFWTWLEFRFFRRVCFYLTPPTVKPQICCCNHAPRKLKRMGLSFNR